MKIERNQYYEGLTDAQQACFRWCAVQLFREDLQELEAQELYGDDYEHLSPLLKNNVDQELEKLGQAGHCDSNLLDGMFQAIKQDGKIHTITDLVCELTQRPHDSTELSQRLRQAFPDEVEAIALEVQRRSIVKRPEARRFRK